MPNSKTKELTRDVIKDVTYIVSIFAPENSEEDPIFLLKNGIFPQYMRYTDIGDGKNLRSLKRMMFFTPADIMRAQITDRVNEYYSTIILTPEAEKLLTEYEERGTSFKTWFSECLESSKKKTIEEILSTVGKDIAFKKDIKEIVADIQSVMKKREEAFEKLIYAATGQLKKYVVLWEYEKCGYSNYIFLTKGENCNVCRGMHGWILKTSNADLGKNLPPLHPNCDCLVGILNNKGQVISLVDGAGNEINPQETKDILEVKPKVLNEWKEKFLGSLEGIGIDYRLAINILNEFEESEDIEDEKFYEWGFSDEFGISYVKLQYKLQKEGGMSVEEYDLLDSEERFRSAKAISDTQALVAGIKLVTMKTPAVVDDSDYDWHVEIERKSKTNKVKVNKGQQDKHILGTNNYRQSIERGIKRSILIEDPQKLLDEYAGTGYKIPNTNKERIDFGKVIGKYCDESTGIYYETTKGIIHYDKKGNAHIIPARP